MSTALISQYVPVFRFWTVCWRNLTVATVRTGHWWKPSASCRWVSAHAHRGSSVCSWRHVYSCFLKANTGREVTKKLYNMLGFLMCSSAKSSCWRSLMCTDSCKPFTEHTQRFPPQSVPVQSSKIPNTRPSDQWARIGKGKRSIKMNTHSHSAAY